MMAFAELKKIRNDQDHCFGCIMIDLSKAFDKINQSLLRILQRYELRGVCLEWFKSYISERKQAVKLGGTNSSFQSVNFGVPQGSILELLLFIIYINDLPNFGGKLIPYLFADDVICLYKQDKESRQNLTHKLDLKYWLEQNNLSLNVEKTQMVFFLGSEKNVVTFNDS